MHLRLELRGLPHPIIYRWLYRGSIGGFVRIMENKLETIILYTGVLLVF